MTEFRLIFKFLDRDFVFRLLFLLLAYSLVPLAEIFLFLYLGELIGNYLILALAATAGLIGVLLALREIQKTLDTLKKKIRKNKYPGKEFVDLVGILVGSIFLLTPGFITDLLGFLLLIPYFRDVLGRAIARRLDKKFREVYEYLKLYDL